MNLSTYVEGGEEVENIHQRVKKARIEILPSFVTVMVA